METVFPPPLPPPPTRVDRIGFVRVGSEGREGWVFFGDGVREMVGRRERGIGMVQSRNGKAAHLKKNKQKQGVFGNPRGACRSLSESL